MVSKPAAANTSTARGFGDSPEETVSFTGLKSSISRILDDCCKPNLRLITAPSGTSVDLRGPLTQPLAL